MCYASRFANAYGICSIAVVVLYYVCVATTYSPIALWVNQPDHTIFFNSKSKHSNLK